MTETFYPISYDLAAKIRKDGVSFKANDNISDFITEEELKYLEKELTQKFDGVLRSLVIDVDNDPNSKGTAKRLAKMYIHEVFSGRYFKKPAATSFPNQEEYKYNGMIVVRAELRSLCAHHHQIMKGVAYIGIIPNNTVLGLSKYIRIAQWCARRGQIQEQLCNQIAAEIKAEIETSDIAVHLAMTHECVENRGVQSHSSLTQTTVLHGEFKNPDVKKEFFDNITLQEMKTGSR